MSEPIIPPPSDSAVKMDKGDLDAIGKVRALKPDLRGIAKDCKSEVRVEKNAFGRDELVTTVPLKVAIEAMRPAYRADAERAGNFDAKQSKETLVAPNGERRQVLASVAADVARNTGSRGVEKRQATSVYRNGKWWTREGGRWVEAPKTCLTRPLFEDDERVAPFGVVH